jgi:hypothetical protein
MEVYVFFWIVFSLVVGFVGSSRNIGFWGAFFLSILLSPLIGLIIALTSKNMADEEFKRELLDTQRRQQEALDRLTGKGRNYQSYESQSYEERSYSKTEKLEKLERLRKTASITEDEYRQIRREILNA